MVVEVPGNRVSRETPPLVACKQMASIKVQSRRQPKCVSMQEWIKKMKYIYTTEYYSAIKKTAEIMPCAATWMQLEMIILNEVSQRKTNTISFICGIYKTGHR